MEREGTTSPLRKEIEDFLNTEGDSLEESEKKALSFRQRIIEGQTTGDHISDYVFGNFLYYLTEEAKQKKEFPFSRLDLLESFNFSGTLDKLQRDEFALRMIEGKLEGRVDEEIFVHGHAPGRLRRWVYKLGIVRSSELKSTIGPEGHRLLAVKTGSYIYWRQNGNPQLVKANIPVYPRPYDYVVGSAEIVQLRQDSWYDRYYPEMATLLNGYLAVRSHR